MTILRPENFTSLTPHFLKLRSASYTGARPINASAETGATIGVRPAGQDIHDPQPAAQFVTPRGDDGVCRSESCPDTIIVCGEGRSASLGRGWGWETGPSSARNASGLISQPAWLRWKCIASRHDQAAQLAIHLGCTALLQEVLDLQRAVSGAWPGSRSTWTQGTGYSRRRSSRIAEEALTRLVWSARNVPATMLMLPPWPSHGLSQDLAVLQGHDGWIDRNIPA